MVVVASLTDTNLSSDYFEQEAEERKRQGYIKFVVINYELSTIYTKQFGFHSPCIISFIL